MPLRTWQKLGYHVGILYIADGFYCAYIIFLYKKIFPIPAIDLSTYYMTTEKQLHKSFHQRLYLEYKLFD